jgi:hypothetical protein
MTRRHAYLGLALGVLIALGGGGLTALPGCYDIPQPACGFVCGAAGECPADYTCSSSDGRCHLDGSAPMVCATPDAGIDAAEPDGPDAPLDALPDAPPDAPIDAARDGALDAGGDATPLDAPVD